MGLVRELYEVTIELKKHWQQRQDGESTDPEELFRHFVEPSYRLFLQVHGNYLELFADLAIRLKESARAEQGSGIDQAMQWLSRERIKMQGERSELREFDLPLVRGVPETRASAVNQAGIDYLAAIRDYFLEPNPVSGLSATTMFQRALIEIWEVLRDAEEGPAKDLTSAANEAQSRLRRNKDLATVLEQFEAAAKILELATAQQLSLTRGSLESAVLLYMAGLAETQLRYFELRVGRVQRSFMRLKILCVKS